MAIYHEDIIDVELQTGNIFRSFLQHSIGLADAAANRFGVRIFRNGEAETLSGVTCQAFFHNANGENIALTSYGTVSGNTAYVTLPQACYNVEGRFTLAIKLVGSGVTSTMRIVDGVVDNTNTGGAVAPTGSVPTYQEVLSVYSQMQAALDDYADVVATQNGQIDDLKGVLTELADTQKMLYFNQTVSGSVMKQINVSLPAGEYNLHVSSVDSSDTQYTTSRITFFGDNTNWSTDVNRLNGTDKTISLSFDVRSIAFYGAHTYSDSAGVSFSYNNVKIVSDTVLSERLNDIDADVTENRSAINEIGNYNLNGLWSVGSVSISTGVTNTTNVRIRTNKINIEDINEIRVDEGYGFNVFAYSGDTYVGCWTGSGFAKTGDVIDYQIANKFDVSVLNGSNVNRIIIVLGVANDTTTVMSLDDYTYVKILGGIIGKINEAVNAIYNQYSVRSLWSVGSVSISTGVTNTTNVRIRTNKINIEDINEIRVDEGYGFNVFAYSGDTYVGCWTGSGFVQNGSALDYQITDNFDVSQLNIYNVDAIIIALGVANDTTTVMSLDDYSHVQLLSGALPKVEADLFTAIEKSNINFQNSNIIGICHKGYNTIAPENTIPAYVLAKQKGFTYCETDVRFTLDGVAVLCHDDGINSVARNIDGSQISETINISESTYDELLNYDFGIKKGQAYAGTKIATFAQFMRCCKALDLIPRIDVKAFPIGVVNTLYTIARNYNMHHVVEWAFQTIDRNAEVVALDNESNLTCGVSVYDENTFNAIAALKTGKNKVNVSVDYNSLTDAIIDGCKERGLTLGVWTINNKATILGLDPYVKFVTSDSLNAGRIWADEYLK